MAARPECVLDEASAWFAGRIPDGWFDAPVRARADRDEIIVTGRLAEPTNVPDGVDAARLAAMARISGFREDTRPERMKIAEAAQMRWHRAVSWEAECGPLRVTFTNASIPTMTRLRFDERQVLDTLIDSGVARSRSEAMAWCVMQVGKHQGDWIDRLRGAMTEVERIRAEGP